MNPNMQTCTTYFAGLIFFVTGACALRFYNELVPQFYCPQCNLFKFVRQARIFHVLCQPGCDFGLGMHVLARGRLLSTSIFLS